jgi:nucleoside 2-deoxyribosyltransferase
MKTVNSIYLITRLYNTDDKICTCELESFLKSRYKHIETYMPYRDTNEDKITEKWKKTIFKKDIEALNASDTIIGYWDGTEYDEGIGFEIGYALSKNKNIIILNSDFLKYAFYKKNRISNYPDPIIEALDIHLIKNVFEMNTEKSFHNDLLVAKHDLMNDLDFSIVKKNSIKYERDKNLNFRYYLEYGNSLIYYNIFKAKKGRNDYLPKRFIENDFRKYSKADLESAMSSEEAYIVVTGPEMNVGCSIICGLCYGLSIPFYLINDRLNTMVAMSDSEMPTNLMIDCACEGYTNIESIFKKMT